MIVQTKPSTQTIRIPKFTNLQTTRCCKGNQGFLICYYPSCKKSNIFLCTSEDCQCYRDHSKCTKNHLKTIINLLIAKVHDASSLVEKFDQMCQKTIDEISKFRDQFIIQFKHTYKYFGLFQDQEHILRKIQGQKSDFLNNFELNSKVSADMISMIYQKKDISNYDLMVQKVQNAWDQINEKMKWAFQRINKLTFENSFFKLDSKIIKSKEDQQILIGFFEKKVQYLQLLYRASQNEFSNEIYHQKCDSMSDTITVVFTEQNKIIGGYTPLKIRTGKGQFIEDPTGESFIFSLTMKDKFTLNNKSSAIKASTNQEGPSFGQSELFIADKGHYQKKNLSFISQNCHYSNKNYPPDDKQSLKKFNGTKSPKFALNQWEVFQVVFY